MAPPFFGIELLALSYNAILVTLTPGNDYFVLVFMQLPLGQTKLIHKLMVLPIYSLNFVLIEMREKLRSQRETVISLTKP